MSISSIPRRREAGWWEQVGLTPHSLGVTGDLHGANEGGLRVLREYEPVAFASKNSDAEQLTIEQLRKLVGEVERNFQLETVEAKVLAAEARRTLGWEKLEAAYALPNADEVIAEGRWAGFSRAAASAWCWNLFQYEPHGFVHPGSQVRCEAMQQLEWGDLPTVFGYPERAKELAAHGLDPRRYRLHKEALGAATFDPSDVRH